MSGSERLMLIASSTLDRTAAFDRAAALTKAMDAPLHIVAFDYSEGLGTAGMVDPKTLAHVQASCLDRHRQWLEEQAQFIRDTGVAVTVEAVWVRQTLEEIMVHIRELQPSMVIKDLEHESWLTRALFTPLALHLLHDCPVPLHLVSRAVHAMPRKILAAVDPFRRDEQREDINATIIATAQKLAAQCDAQLHLLYVHDLSSVLAGEGEMDFLLNPEETIYEAQEAAFNALADRFGVPCERKHFVMGNPAAKIESFARTEDIDVIVMGTAHRNHLTAVLSRTIEQVAYHMPSSLLAVNPHPPQ
jgi:universal stress protein E